MREEYLPEHGIEATLSGEEPVGTTGRAKMNATCVERGAARWAATVLVVTAVPLLAALFAQRDTVRVLSRGAVKG